MATRLKLRHQDEIREKIRTSQIVNRLENHFFGEVELTQSQVKVAEILLRKTMPDLSATELSGAVTMTQEESIERIRERAGVARATEQGLDSLRSGVPSDQDQGWRH